MQIPDPLTNGLMKSIDIFYALRPQPFPGKARLSAGKIVSHRGEHDNRNIFENTMRAFDIALEKGVWGIEFDVRWTKDLQPVVAHDADLERVFGKKQYIKKLTLTELRSQCPQVPLLEEVVQVYGQRLHFMVEIKAEEYPEPDLQNQILAQCFSPLAAEKDYHLMSLEPEMLNLITFVPKSNLIPIAFFNVGELSRLSLAEGYGGVAGHYLLLNRGFLKEHHEKGQKIGTGYPGSKNCLYREINRGVEWIFSNNAGKIQRIVQQMVNA